jgi:hypothetical protein
MDHFELALPSVLLGAGLSNVDGDSFWRGCSELRSAGMGRWMLAAGKAAWPKGHPPSFKLTLVEPGRFSLSA